MAEPLEPPRPGLEFLARFTVELDAPVWDLGPTSALGTRRIAVTSGGPLAAAARAEGVPVIPLPGGFQPRAAIAYLVVSALTRLL